MDDATPFEPDAGSGASSAGETIASTFLDVAVRSWQRHRIPEERARAHPAALRAEFDVLLNAVDRAHRVEGTLEAGPWVGALDRPELDPGPRRNRLYPHVSRLAGEIVGGLLGPHRPADAVRPEALRLLDRLDEVADAWLWDCLREAIARTSAPDRALIDAFGGRDPDGLALAVVAQSPYLDPQDALYLMRTWPSVLSLATFAVQIGRSETHYATLAAQLAATDWAGRRGEALLPHLVDRLQRNPSVAPDLKLWIAAAMADRMGLDEKEARELRDLIEARLETLRREQP